ncbi:MAG: RdgB/HAM1 family non-canonical purine NTP pyrophosphatase [Planctomycetaceae bacterium]
MSTDSLRTLVLASRNAKKLAELRDLLQELGIDVRSVGDFPAVPEVEEDGDTFAANAAKKATEVARRLGEWAMGEDSGLMVDALGGAPGVYSARYSGPGASDESNNAKLIAELGDVPAARRGAQYVCHIAISDPSGRVRLTIERTCRGRIIAEPRGTSGFGYDPYFLIREYHRTFAELGQNVKRAISHRGRAMGALMPALREITGRT